MKIGRILKKVAVAAAPVVATAVGGPEAGLAAAGVLGGGKVGHMVGQKLERKTGRPLDKATAPAGNVLAALLVVKLIGPEKIELVCRAVEKACLNPEAAAVALIGIGLAVYRYCITIVEKISKAEG